MHKKIAFDWSDPFLLNMQLTEKEQNIKKEAHKFAQNILLPQISLAFREEVFPIKIMKDMAQLGFLGANISSYGCAGMSNIAYGLIAYEIESIDSAFRSALSIQSSLVMQAINKFGSEQQKEYYLPKLAKADLIGCFALTEPNHGSDPGSMETLAKKIDSGYLLNGHKKWIGLSPIADIFIIWAKDEDGLVHAYLVEKNTEGLTVLPIKNKLSLRAAAVGEILLKDVKVNLENELPFADGLSAALSCLDHARYGIAWGALGAANFCWQTAREYVLNRKQFGEPLAANQLIQFKLANMQTQIHLGLQACMRAGQLKDQGMLSSELISLIKRNSALVALDVARTARDMMGANGILEENHVMRHLMNLETVNTYEGTQDIHALILGYAQTGIQAFSFSKKDKYN